MTIKSFYSSFLLVFMLVFAAACDDDKEITDSKAPTLNIDAPERTEFVAGELVTISGTVSDEQKLDKVILRVEVAEGTAIVELSQQQIIDDYSGTFSFDIPFPVTAPTGLYTLQIEVFDLAGNSYEDNLVIRLLEADRSKPEVTFTGPDGNQFHQGDSLVLTILVQDNKRIDSLALSLFTPENEDVFSILLLPDTAGAAFRFDYIFPLDANPGIYTARARAVDAAGNDSTLTREFILTTLDVSSPEISFTGPVETSFQTGEQVTFSGSVSDNQQVDFVRLRILNPDGTEIHANTQQIGASSGDFRFAFTFPADGAYGTYIATATAHDPAGNTYSQSLSLTVNQTGLISFTVANLPADTPPGEALYISGEFAQGSWVQPGSDERFRLTDNGNGTYSINLDPATTTGIEGIVQYKFARQGGWNTVEVTAGCAPIDNRSTATDGSVTEVGDIAIGAWNDICQPEAGPSITFTVTDIPANTPAEEGLYISGEFSDGLWAEPGTNENFRLTGNGDGTYSITLPVSAGTYEAGVARYKFFRQGGWATTEGAAECVHIDERKIASDGSVIEVDAIQIINWMDLCQ